MLLGHCTVGRWQDPAGLHGTLKELSGGSGMSCSFLHSMPGIERWGFYPLGIYFPSPPRPQQNYKSLHVSCDPPRPRLFPHLAVFTLPQTITCRTSCCQAIGRGCPLPTIPPLFMPGCWARSSCRATCRRSCSSARVSRSKRASCSFTEARMLAAECTLQSSIARVPAACRQSRTSSGWGGASTW